MLPQNVRFQGEKYGESHGVCDDRHLQHSILEVSITSFICFLKYKSGI